MSRFILAVACVAAPLCAVEAYSVEPVKAEWSGRAKTVSQTIACNFDSLDYVELFVGDISDGGEYRCVVLVDGDELMSASARPARACSWLRFADWDERVEFTKTRPYELRFTCSGPDSIDYYYNASDPYWHGWLRVGSTDRRDRDLCCRLRGVMDVIDSTLWGVNADFPEPPWRDSLWHKVRSHVADAGVRSVRTILDWHAIQFGGADSWNHAHTDSVVNSFHDTGCEIIGLFSQCPKWASSSFGHEMEDSMDIRCPPQNLFLPIDDTLNYWARFVEWVAERYGDKIDVYEIWNEPNDNCTLQVEGITGWWKIPNVDTAYSKECRSWPRGVCSLYVRLCCVAARVIGRIDPGARILVGSTHNVDFRDENRIFKVGGRSWIDMCYEMAKAEYGGTFWDGISVHPYHDWDGQPGFDPGFLESEAKAARDVMRGHGHFDELWNTEMGWDSVHPESYAANNVCEMFVTSLASEALPQGGYDGSSWFWFWRPTPEWTKYGLVADPVLSTRSFLYFAFRQLSTVLTGRRFCRRVLSGDSATDANTRVYEFADAEDRTCWVGWMNDRKGHGGSVDFSLPVGTDHAHTAPVARASGDGTNQAAAEPDGWLELALTLDPCTLSNRPRRRLSARMCEWTAWRIVHHG